MTNKILNFFFELGQLRRIKHEGWRTIGINNPESVADHSLRAAQIAYVLAKLENYKKPEEVVTMVASHQLGYIWWQFYEYLQADEKQAVIDQTKPLEKIGKDIYELWESAELQKNAAGKIAKDADLLEQAITAKEYIEKGNKFAQNWIDNIAKKLLTKSAKFLVKDLGKNSSHDWWKEIKKKF